VYAKKSSPKMKVELIIYNEKFVTFLGLASCCERASTKATVNKQMLKSN